jgi:hypothetical protein
MREYEVKTRFSFAGTFYIKAKNKEEAKEFVEEHCGLVLNRGIHSTLPDETADWDFPVHPKKTVGRIRINKKELCYEQTA